MTTSLPATKGKAAAKRVAARQRAVGTRPVERISLAEQAYALIKHAIITCDYMPGECLNESQLCEFLGIGRTPIHHATKKLQTQGLIDIIPRKGIMIRPVSLDEIMDINDIRLINEVECVRLASERIVETELEALDAVLAASAKAIERRDVKALILLDRDFHGILARASRNAILAEFLGIVHERALRVWFISLNDAQHLREVYAEHRAIVDALRTRDTERVMELMRAHLRSTARNLMRHSH